MVNKCLYQRVRRKNCEVYYYCTKNCENVVKTCYIGCGDREIKKAKPLRKKSKKQKELESNRFSIIQKDLNHCFFCNKRAVDWHELIKGVRRKKCIKWGLCVRVCRECHRKTEEDMEFYKNTRIFAQKTWQDFYGKNEADFIKEFGRSWLR